MVIEFNYDSTEQNFWVPGQTIWVWETGESLNITHVHTVQDIDVEHGTHTHTILYPTTGGNSLIIGIHTGCV